ncbi:MAG TPA: DNA polymerase ligase N-terminal domain-containing protein [Acidobacteriota bacterium]|nr:DNA polymerase ligase N-terminal domain-containing protein [Acidobacteriota bacterium]
MSLKEYAKKRDLGKTPEPAGGASPKGRAEGLVYVIQKHAASHLHYDLRLEENGVLASWAIPKTPPAEKGEKRLAVRTEDHPLDYADFEGVIPEPEYGAGTVEIWDRGTYTAVETTDSKRVVDIRGRKLNGRYALVRIKPRAGEKNVNWLFFRMK